MSSSVRLTTRLVDKIIAALLHHRFGLAAQALVDEQTALADETYSDIYRKSDQERMDALPDGWLPEESVIVVQFGEASGYAHLQFGGRPYDLRRFIPKDDENKCLKRRVLSKHANGCCIKVYDANHRLSIKYGSYIERYETFLADARQAETQARAALNAVSTTGLLIKTWPEIEPFVRPYVPEDIQLPAVPTAQLNSLLNLPAN